MVAKALTVRLAAAVLTCLLLPGAARAETRIALVIGNSTYQNALALGNPRLDADAIAASMERLGFSVSKVTEANFDSFRRALLSFGREARSADMAVVYYSGHGLEMNGENWLIPVDAELKNDIDVENEAISLHSLMQTVSSAKTLGLILLDSCRQNPFLAKMQRSSQTRAIERGLARVEPNSNVLVVFAAKDGTTADDSSGEHSAFTQALLNNIETPGLEVNFLFRNVRDDVLDETHETQEPFLYGSLSQDEIYLKPAADADNAAPRKAVSATVETPADEIAWSYLQHSTEPTILRGFLEQFPSSGHVGEARQRIASIDAPQVTTDAGPSAPLQPDEISWSFLSESTDQASLHRFLEKFPTSRYSDAARARIESLERLGSQPDLGSNAARASGNPAREPDAGRPLGKDKGIARHFRRMTPEVEQAWKVIKASKDPATLLAFSEDFPTRPHKTLVQQTLSEVGAVPALGQRASDAYYVGECDRLAADPGDASKPSSIAGVEYGSLDVRRAVIVCHQAILRHPDVARLKYQLCRCLVKLGDTGRAAGECSAAVHLAEANNDTAAQLYSATSQAIQPLLSDGNSVESTSLHTEAEVTPPPPQGSAPTSGDFHPAVRHEHNPKRPIPFRPVKFHGQHIGQPAFRNARLTAPRNAKVTTLNHTNLSVHTVATRVRVQTPDIRVPTVTIKVPR